PFGPLLHRGTRIYPASLVHEVWAMLRDFAPVAPDAVSLILAIGRAEPAADYPASVAGKPIVIIGYNHSGDAGAVQRDVAPLSAGPQPVVSTDGSQPYLEVQTANDLAMGWGHRSFIGGIYANDVRPEALDALVEHVAGGPKGGTFGITVQGGAIGRVPEDAMAFTGREARFDLSADADWEDAADDDVNREWVQQALAIVEQDAVTGRYCNESSATGPDVTRAIYGDAKLTRLTALKRVWDPENVFHLNYNIAP
ncbi:MAG TPA: BBE domain-containing protein, partial [Candidatus Acidoferrum sp.]|nr:BBE domain-containing protein [Candidatus Acidoferrum sp.]